MRRVVKIELALSTAVAYLLVAVRAGQIGTAAAAASAAVAAPRVAPTATASKELSLDELTELWNAKPEDVVAALVRGTLDATSSQDKAEHERMHKVLEDGWQEALADFKQHSILRANTQPGAAAALIERESRMLGEDEVANTTLAAAREEQRKSAMYTIMKKEVQTMILRRRGNSELSQEQNEEDVKKAASLLETTSTKFVKASTKSVKAWVPADKAPETAPESAKKAIEEVVKTLSELETYKKLKAAATAGRLKAAGADAAERGMAITTAVVPVLQEALGVKLRQFDLDAHPLAGLMQLQAKLANDADGLRKLHSVLDFLDGSSRTLFFAEAEAMTDM